MKLKALMLGFCASVCSFAFAGNQSLHFHPKAQLEANTSIPSMAWASYCEIEIVNKSYEDVTVYGTYDDGAEMEPFNVYSGFIPRYISLYYYGECHPGMYLSIYTFDGDYVYSGYVRGGKTLRIVPYLNKQLKAEVTAKS